MSHRKIPAELEPAILEFVKQKKSTRAIADWLKTKHELDVSHMAVHRLIERLRIDAFGAPDVDAELAEAHGSVGEMLRTLKALADQFGELGERAMEGDSKAGVEGSLKLAGQFFARQARLINDWFCFLERLIKGRDEEWRDYRKALSGLSGGLIVANAKNEAEAMRATSLAVSRDDVARRAAALQATRHVPTAA